MMSTPTRVEKEIGGRTLSIETGKLAKQAHGGVTVQFGETVVLGTAVTAPPREGIDFFPLQVDYREKMPAAGKFPGGFRKREGAPSTKETLTMRNIDRPIRPMFPKHFKDEVQIQCWVLAADTQNEPDVLAAIAASAALSVSPLPFQGPIASVRVGRVDGQFVLMPTAAQNEFSDLDLLLAGHHEGVNMIEVGSHELDEETVAEAIRFGHEHIQTIADMIGELQQKAGKEKNPAPGDPAAEIADLVEQHLAGPLRAAKTAPGGKADRQAAVDEAIDAFLAEHLPEPGADASYAAVKNHEKKRKQAQAAIGDLEKRITREVIRSGVRTDGRAHDEIRGISCEVHSLPRVHGSAIFSRGETQALVTTTLGTGKDEQIVDGLGEEYAEKFYLHYNFPPFSVGECKRIAGPSRRDIGHGMLAQKALQPVLPEVEKFPYTVRLVSDILESNGSSSMASVCGGSLALMDAGVPILNPVAGISIGLVAADGPGEEDIYLTDIQGEEDHFGDMDFKVAGTSEGITAIQLDLKLSGLTLDQVKHTLEQARRNRMQILELMKHAIAEPRPETSPHAPRILTTSVPQDKIGALIGPGGKTIRSLEETTGARIEIDDEGTVTISAVGGGKAERALEEVEKLTAEVKVDQIYSGRVTSVKDFGAFVELVPGRDGLLHISELDEGYVNKVGDIVQEGDTVRVKVLSVDEQGRVRLSRKAVMAEEGGEGQQKAEASSAS